MATTYKTNPYGTYTGTVSTDIDTLISLIKPGTVEEPKLAAEPAFSIIDDAVAELIINELNAIKAAQSGG